MFSCFSKKNIKNSVINTNNTKDNMNTNININTTEYKSFDLNNVEGDFYVDSVYDGDTITLLIPIQTHIYNIIDTNLNINPNSDNNKQNNIFLNKIRVRLLGIDTPEIKPKKDIENREEQIAKAKEARDFLSNLILNKVIRTKFINNDKYGRPLVNLYDNEICINELMIENGYAKRYAGGTKEIWK